MSLSWLFYYNLQVVLKILHWHARPPTSLINSSVNDVLLQIFPGSFRIVSRGYRSSLMTYDVMRISHSCQILPVDGAWLSLDTFVTTTPVKNGILELFRPAFRVLPKTGDRTGRMRQIWLRTVEDDLRPLNFGLATAKRRALDWSTRCQLMETAVYVTCSGERGVMQLWRHQPIKKTK